MSGTLSSFANILLFSNLRAIALVVLALGLLAVIRTAAGSQRHVIWLTVIAGCLMLPMVSTVVPSLPIPLLPAEAPILAGAEVINAALETGDAAGETPGRTVELGFWLLVSIYAGGVFALIGHFAISVIRLARFERSMSPWRDRRLIEFKNALCHELKIGRSVQLLESDSVGSPFTWGVWRPHVVLPAAARHWSVGRINNVLRHEIYHVRRFDWLWLCLQQLATAIYWFNPFVWLAVRQCRYEAERACDDFVLDCGGESVDYAEQLVDLMVSSRQRHAVAVSLGDGDFVRRIRAILNPTKEVRMMSRCKTQITTIGVAASVVVLAACQVTNGQPAADQQRVVEEVQIRSEAAQREVDSVRNTAEVEARERAIVAAQAANAQRAAVAVERAKVSAERAEADAASSDSRASALNEQLAVMARALEEQQLVLRQSQEQLLRQERALQELGLSIDRQADMLVQRERELAERQRALAELAALGSEARSGESDEQRSEQVTE